MQTKDIKTIKKQSKKLYESTERLASLYADVNKGKVNPFEAMSEIDSILKAIAKVREEGNVLEDMVEFAVQFKEEMRQEGEKKRLQIVNEIAEGLEALGLKVTGNLPILKAGVFTLEFEFVGKAGIKVYFGPQIELLGKCGIQAECVVDLISKTYKMLYEQPFDPEEFLRNLLKAYINAARVNGVSIGERVRITDVMLQYVLLMQSKRFLSDPQKAAFKPISRLEFAVMLSKVAKLRKVDGWELRLDVASIAQTRDSLDHIWVPMGTNGSGTHFSTMRFVRREEDE